MAALAVRRYGLPELGRSLDAAGGGSVAAAMASWAVAAARLAGSRHAMEVWCACRAGVVQGICLSDGSHATIVQAGRRATDPAARQIAEVLAHGLHRAGRRYRSILGPPEAVVAACEALAHPWRGPDRVDRRYLFMTADGPPECARRDPLVRVARTEDLGPVLDASVKAVPDVLTAARGPLSLLSLYSVMADSVSRGRCFVRFDGDDIVFKAETVPVSPDLFLIQGVWIAPSHRGRGMSAGAVAAVAGLARQSATTAALFVDARNEPARRCYRRVGFTDTASVLHAKLAGP
jgi:GNAT superfamily N-acetyltransferase